VHAKNSQIHKFSQAYSRLAAQPVWVGRPRRPVLPAAPLRLAWPAPMLRCAPRSPAAWRVAWPSAIALPLTTRSHAPFRAAVVTAATAAGAATAAAAAHGGRVCRCSGGAERTSRPSSASRDEEQRAEALERLGHMAEHLHPACSTAGAGVEGMSMRMGCACRLMHPV
jgi:hypothetical protein